MLWLDVEKGGGGEAMLGNGRGLDCWRRRCDDVGWVDRADGFMGVVEVR